MDYILGIDQGGSKTHAVAADGEGRILGFGRGPGDLYLAAGMDHALDSVEKAAGEALQTSGLTWDDISYISAGMTGVDWDYEKTMFEDAFRKRFHKEKIFVENDCIIAMRAGTNSRFSGILCAGSGLNCALQSPKERFIYGYYIPKDRDGGGALARRTVQAVYNAQLDLGPATALTKAVLDHFGEKSVDSLLYTDSMKGLPQREFMQLSVVLDEAAAKGDQAALEIQDDFGRKMAECLTARIRLMDLTEEKIDIVLSGGIFKAKCPRLVESAKEEILSCAPGANIISAEYEPVVGAVLMVLDRIYDGGIPDVVYARLRETAETFPLRRLVTGDVQRESRREPAE